MIQTFYKWSKQRQDQGFSLTEVMVSIVVLGLFMFSSTSLMAYAAATRARSRSESQLTDRLQTLMDQVRDQAAGLDPGTTAGTYNPNATACNATAVANGYGKRLENNIPALTTAETTAQLEKGQSYTISRTLEAVNVAPFDRLKVIYTVTPQENGDPITMETEVIPNAAFSCS
jgi:prepilin-type N-terminal cleavage/methylation domain-containing protein